MKRDTRGGVPIYVSLLAWLALASQLPAQNWTTHYSDFSSLSGLGLQGEITQAGNRLRLTSAGSPQTGGVWLNTRQFLGGGFETVFRFQVTGTGTNGDAGEGLAFVLQNSALPCLGQGAAGLGYSGIPNSLVVEFDARQNPESNDPAGGHISVHTRGALANQADHAASLGSVNCGTCWADGNVHTGKIVFSLSAIRVYLDDLTNAVLSVSLDPENSMTLEDGQAWAGFTASTSGSASADQDLLEWQFTPAPAPLTVQLATPLNGASYLAPASIVLEAAAQSTGAVSSVAYYQGSTKIGEATTPPFTLNWRNVIPGTYWLTALASDDAGQRAMSPPVQVTVYPAQPGIGLNFSSGADGADYPLAYSDRAGVVAQRVWNNLATPASGAGIAYNLRDGAGVSSAVDVGWEFAGTGDEAKVNAGISPDHRLMKAYLEDTGGEHGAQTNSVIAVGSIPFAVYDVLVYSDGANGPADRVTEFRLAGQTRWLRDAPGATFAGIFVEGTGGDETPAGAPAGNYVRFNSLTNSSFTLVVSAVASSDGTRRAAVNALQIIPSVNSATPLQLIRGPYLQSATTSNILIRWRTDRPTDAVVRYGRSPGELTLTNTDTVLTSEHIMRLDGLQPATRYYYAVGTTETNLASGSGQFFVTFPTSPKPVRIWATSDTQVGGAEQRAVRDAYYQFAEDFYTDVWISMGDTGGNSGTDRDYQGNFFGMYPGMLAQTAVWPTIGNHDTYAATASGDMPILHMFLMPTNAEAGGVSSGSPRYCSFDYANVHFIRLDSASSDRSVGGAMYEWLKRDLAAHRQTWVIAYFHHTPYTKGSHDSDAGQSEIEMTEMRQNFLPLLEEGGVDLVLCGHSHVYERSFLLDGHYGFSWDFRPEMIKDRGDGRWNGSGPYRKTTNTPPSHQGTVYVTAGISGEARSGSLNHPVMFLSASVAGSLVIDVNGDTLDFRLLRETGVMGDYFTMVKQPAVQITEFNRSGESVTLTWLTVPGKIYAVHRATRLDTPDWQILADNLEANADRLSLTLGSGATGTAGFYRVVTTR